MSQEPDRAAEYLLVREIRNLLKRCDTPRSDRTQEDYRKKYARMASTGLLPEHARTRQSYYAYRAALIHGTLEHARDALRRRDRAAYGSGEWAESIEDLEQARRILQRYPPDPERQHGENGSPASPWSDVAKARSEKPHTLSKRRALSYLSRVPDWRTRLFAEIPPDYKAAVAISALTGERPSEIARGVEITREGEALLIRIPGAKLTRRSGQAERRLLVTVDSVEASYLHALTAEGPATIQAGAQALCATVERAGRRAFPDARQLVSPYVFRHALASRLKAEGHSPEIIAECLGHRATDSQTAYGRAVFGGGPSGILGVSASQPVRTTHRAPSAMLQPSYAPAPSPTF